MAAERGEGAAESREEPGGDLERGDAPDYEQFRDALRDALNHLHDPDYEPSRHLIQVIGGETGSEGVRVQQAILRAIEELAPAADAPDSAHVRRIYRLLRYRFVQRLTQEQTADHLHLTVRSIRREQRVATHVLARYLWEHRLSRHAPHAVAGAAKEDGGGAAVSSRTWRSQARRELAALRAENPAAVAEVAPLVRRVVELERRLVVSHGGALKLGELPEDLHVAVHPTALRQVLIMAIGQVCRVSACGDLTVSARESDGAAVVEVVAPPCADTLPELDLLDEMVRLLGGRTRVTRQAEQTNLTLTLPAVGAVTVAVVDDNADFVHFCRRCARGTRYRIVAPASGSAAAIKDADPDIVLLDIMLPGVDGWELLGELQADTATAAIPVIICSIVHEAELASLMGAVEYLPKPVQYQDLLATLDRVSEQSPALERPDQRPGELKGTPQ